jgi:hypothetical protein
LTSGLTRTKDVWVLTDQTIGDAIGVTVTGLVALAIGIPFAVNIRGSRDRMIERSLRQNRQTPRIFRRSDETMDVIHVIVPAWFVLIGIISLGSETAALVTGHIG